MCWVSAFKIAILILFVSITVLIFNYKLMCGLYGVQKTMLIMGIGVITAISIITVIIGVIIYKIGK